MTTQIIKSKDLRNELIIKLLQNKYKLKIERNKKTEQAREIRQEAYNLTKQINQMEIQIDQYLLKIIR